MQKVRAKFYCVSVEDAVEGSKNITLNAVTSGSEENKSFFKYTPTGQITFNCVNDEASALFEPGKEYYVGFEKAVIDAIEEAEVSTMDQTTPVVPPPPKP